MFSFPTGTFLGGDLVPNHTCLELFGAFLWVSFWVLLLFGEFGNGEQRYDTTTFAEIMTQICHDPQ
jgi:hypothetical protein